MAIMNEEQVGKLETDVNRLAAEAVTLQEHPRSYDIKSYFCKGERKHELKDYYVIVDQRAATKLHRKLERYTIGAVRGQLGRMSDGDTVNDMVGDIVVHGQVALRDFGPMGIKGQGFFRLYRTVISNILGNDIQQRRTGPYIGDEISSNTVEGELLEREQLLAKKVRVEKKGKTLDKKDEERLSYLNVVIAEYGDDYKELVQESRRRDAGRTTTPVKMASLNDAVGGTEDGSSVQRIESFSAGMEDVEMAELVMLASPKDKMVLEALTSCATIAEATKWLRDEHNITLTGEEAVRIGRRYVDR